MNIDFNIILEKIKRNNINLNVKNNIKKCISSLFPNLNDNDKDILFYFTQGIMYKIVLCFNFKADDYEQFIQNNFRDIKGIILLLLPFIDDKNNNKLLIEMTDLNQFLYGKITNRIPDLSNIDRNELLKTDFRFSNMCIGLMNEGSFDLYENDIKLIYKIICHNYVGLLKSLEIMNGKYYVNWINIFPILLDSYKSSPLYIKTIVGLDKLKNNKDMTHFFDNYYGLYIGDIYNVIKIKLYDEIKHIKWMIYGAFDKKYNIQYIAENINLNTLFKYNNYSDLDNNEKKQFDSDIMNQIEQLQTNSKVCNLWKDFLLFLTNDYSSRFVVKNETSISSKFSFTSTLEQNDFAEEDFDNEYTIDINKLINNISDSDVFEFMSSINVRHIWKFLYESIKKLENTYLKEYLIKNSQITSTYYFPNNKHLNFKNIYNIAKSLTHNKKWISYDRHFISFSSDNINEFFEKYLDNINYQNWLFLKNNIIREYGIGVDVKSKLREIYLEWYQIKTDLIFEILIKNGLLSEFKTNYIITDKNNYISSKSKKIQIQEKIKKYIIDENKNMENAYYFLTNDIYKNLTIQTVNERTKEIKKKTFFQSLNEYDWYSFYAMDWLAQINFFHHYINHRVLYVTGATGQGKSTQVPKLLLYALKAYDFKNNGRVICTQPRIPPTINNAERIALELGVQIIKPEKILNNITMVKSDDFYVQMKYSGDSHIKNDCPHLTLKIMTDGTLYEELQTNPLMKQQIFNNTKTDFVYGFENYYDIIIVDESHEHNTNMDLILTLMKQSCMYNNSLRLIIMSATMDDDEPIYRSYFKAINDNLLYPIKSPYYSNMLPETTYMDRRFHISPPGETTQNKVTEYYTNNLQIDNLSEKKASEKAQELGYDKILEICQKYPTGEILFFLTGMNEINKATKKLNEILPLQDIALPYYSDLHDNYKNIITNIDKKIGFIKNKKDRIYIEWSKDYVEDNTVPSDIYKRAIIIATNVAEASITIPTLKFVVDTGYAKVNTFNIKTKITELNIEKITEASRIQRKGRVGRVSEGVVYFMYPEKSREKILPKYKITQEDNSSLYLKLLADKINNEYVIVPEYNPNLIYSKENYFYKLKLKKLDMKKEFFKKQIYQILIKQYSINNNIIKVDDYWNKNLFPISILNNNAVNRVNNGQLIQNLLDCIGEFYIIHPKENYIIRNINNVIIKYKNNIVTNIPINDYYPEIDFLKKKLIIDDVNDSFNINNIKYDNINLVKSDLYNRITKFKKQLNNTNINTDDCITLFASIGFNCYIEVISIIILVKTISTIQALITNKNEFYNKWYMLENSELMILHNIITSIRTDLNDLFLFKIMDKPNYIKEIDNRINIVISEFKKYLETNELKTISFGLLNILNKLYNNGKLENINGKETLRLYFLNKYIQEDIILKDAKIKLWCTNNHINYEMIILFINNLSELYCDFITIDKNLDIEMNEISSLKWIDDIKSRFSKILKSNNIKEKIIKSFIIGNPLNYAIRLDSKNNYYSLYDPNIRGYIMPSKMILSNIIFYYNYSDMNGNMMLNIVNNVDIDYFTFCIPHIFNKNKFKKIISTQYIDDKFIEHKSFIQVNGSNYDSIVAYINNNNILEKSIWDK